MNEFKKYIHKQKLIGIIIGITNILIFIGLLIAFLLVKEDGHYIWWMLPLIVVIVGFIFVGLGWFNMANQNKILEYKLDDLTVNVFKAGNQYIYANGKLVCEHKGPIKNLELRGRYLSYNIRSIMKGSKVILYINDIRMEPIKK